VKYKLVVPLKTRHVEPWAEYIQSEKVMEHSQPKASSLAVKKAAECGWFDGELPDVDELEPKDVIELATLIYNTQPRWDSTQKTCLRGSRLRRRNRGSTARTKVSPTV
jgi:hypothetical protein